MININRQDFATLCICALRYCHGRRTYMPSEVQRIVSEHFCDLSSRDLAVIEQDKSFQSHMDMWGDQCDKADWLRFYKELEKFRERGQTMRLIDADELLTAFPVDDEPTVTKSCIRMTIQNMPTIEPKQGEWIYPTDIIGFGRCGSCGSLWDKSLIDNIFFKYCPRCGTRMRGADDD